MVRTLACHARGREFESRPDRKKPKSRDFGFFLLYGRLCSRAFHYQIEPTGISTLDNPGWTIRIDLRDTALENLAFNKDYQNPKREHDWFHFKTDQHILIINCGPQNLEDVFRLFLDDIIPNFSDREFTYEIYLPLVGHRHELWIPAEGIIVNEETLKLTKIARPNYKAIKVREVNQFDFGEEELEGLGVDYKVGDEVTFSLEEVFDGVILSAVSK